MRDYSVEFRISGRELDPSDVTENLELKPSLVRRVGDARGKSSRWEEATWGFDGFPEEPESRQWGSLEEGLRFVLQALLPIKDKLEYYKSSFSTYFWCGHFQTSTNESFSLSPALLAMLGELGVELTVDCYCAEEDEEG